MSIRMASTVRQAGQQGNLQCSSFPVNTGHFPCVSRGRCDRVESFVAVRDLPVPGRRSTGGGGCDGVVVTGDSVGCSSRLLCQTSGSVSVRCNVIAGAVLRLRRPMSGPGESLKPMTQFVSLVQKMYCCWKLS
jgi:hypothetical protein